MEWELSTRPQSASDRHFGISPSAIPNSLPSFFPFLFLPLALSLIFHFLHFTSYYSLFIFLLVFFSFSFPPSGFFHHISLSSFPYSYLPFLPLLLSSAVSCLNDWLIDYVQRGSFLLTTLGKGKNFQRCLICLKEKCSSLNVQC